MKISIISPHSSNNGNTVTAILLALCLTELKRKVLLTHVRPQSSTMEGYLGFEAYEDKTSTPTQLVKLMREKAIAPENIGDYSKNLEDYLDVFANSNKNFSKGDMETLLRFIVESDTKYEYTLFDIDSDNETFDEEFVVRNSDIIIFNINNRMNEINRINDMRKRIGKAFKGKKIIVVCSNYSTASGKLKDLSKELGMNTTIYPIRHNPWVEWACNRGKLEYLFLQGKTKDKDVLEVYRDVMTIVSAVTKAKAQINKEKETGKVAKKEVLNKW